MQHRPAKLTRANKRVAKSSTSFAKGNAHRFKVGQVANPKGRPRVVDDIHALARQHAPAAIDALVKALADPERAIPAAIAILDRGYGRPAQAILAQVHTHFEGGIDSPPRESLAQWLQRREREMAALEGAVVPDGTPVEAVSSAAVPPNGGRAAEPGDAVARGERVAEREAPALRQAGEPSVVGAPPRSTPGEPALVEREAGAAQPREDLSPDQELWLKLQRQRLGLDLSPRFELFKSSSRCLAVT
jgi:hypothetical protein